MDREPPPPGEHLDTAGLKVSVPMLHAAAQILTHLDGRPLLLWAGLLVLFIAVRRVGLRTSSRHRTEALIAYTSLLALLIYPAIALWYASDPHFFDNAEPTMTAIGWLSHVGEPLYHATGSAERYAHIYGPLAFMCHGFVFAVFGPSIEASKALGAAAGMASVVLLYGALRVHASRVRGASLAGLYALMLLGFRHYSFWTRPDPLQLLCVTTGLFFAASRGGYAASLGVGLASGILWNLKFTGPLYSLALFAILYQRTRVRGTLLAGMVAMVVCISPFLLFPNVSLANYIAWVRLSSATGLLFSTLRQNLEWAGFLSLPLLLSYYAVRPGLRPDGPAWQTTVVALCAGITGVVLAAAKPGAGPYHLMPFMPIVVYLVAWHLARLPTVAVTDPLIAQGSAAFVFSCVVIAIAQQTYLLSEMQGRRGGREIDDIEHFAATHQGVVEMGYGRTEALSLARPVLVFRNRSYFLDQPAVREHQLAGLDVPSATIAALERCQVTYWLIPKNEAPFSGVNGYGAVFQVPLYPAEFRDAFLSTYEHVETTAYYDAWQCRSARQ